MTTTTGIEHVNGTDRTPQQDEAELASYAVAAARAEAIRIEAEAKAQAEIERAKGEAEAARIKAAEEAEKQRIANARAAQRLEKEQADHDVYVAKKRKEQAREAREARDIEAKEQAEQQEQADHEAELERTERLWKWGARAIYVVGLIIAAPVQFIAFWDPQRPFLLAAPLLLEGLALALAAGAAWAVANRRDVLRYRIGIMCGAMLAAGINLWHGIVDDHIGINAGLIGAIASLGGPVVLMAYEHGIAQRADGIPSRRDRRAADRAAKKKAAEEAARKRETEEAEARKKAEEAAACKREEEEQKRRDADREKEHPEVWKVADAMRSARGERFVTEAIWSEAWYRKTGSKVVGVTPEFEAESRVAQAKMRAASEGLFAGVFPQVDSQKAPRPKKAPDAPDGRRNNGGVPPRRTPGDTQPYTPAAKKQAAIEQAAKKGSDQ